MKHSLEAHKFHLDSLYGNNEFKVALINGQQSSFNFIINSDLKTFNANHDFVSSTRVRANVNPGGSLPNGINSNTDYYVINPNNNSFQLSESKNGAAIVCTGQGSGVFTILEQPLDINLDSDLANWVRHEVNYNGENRKSYIPGLSRVGKINNIYMAYTETVTILFKPTNGSINLRYLIVIRNGNFIAKDTAGIIDHAEDYLNEFTIAKDTQKAFALTQKKYNP